MTARKRYKYLKKEYKKEYNLTLTKRLVRLQREYKFIKIISKSSDLIDKALEKVVNFQVENKEKLVKEATALRDARNSLKLLRKNKKSDARALVFENSIQKLRELRTQQV